MTTRECRAEERLAEPQLVTDGSQSRPGKFEPPSTPSTPRPLLRHLHFRTGDLQRYANTPEVIGLPRDLSQHWRGIWNTLERRVYGRFNAEDVLLPESGDRRNNAGWLTGDSWTLCHNKPISSSSVVRGDESRFPDIPDRLDLFFLLVSQFKSIAFVGVRKAAMIQRNNETIETKRAMEKLVDWLNDPARGKYRKSRGRAQLRRRRRSVPTEQEVLRQFARSALRAAGLRWPRKPRDREREWPNCFRELGLTVELFDAPPFSPRRIR